jgi:hypothetical protein
VYTVVKKNKNFAKAITNSRGFGYFFVCYLVLDWISPTNITANAPKELILCFGFCFAREIAYLQIAHVMDSDYKPMNYPNFLILSLLMLNSVGNAFKISIFNEYYFLLLMILAAFLSYSHLVYYSCKEITTELKIPVFAMPSKKSSRKT